MSFRRSHRSHRSLSNSPASPTASPQRGGWFGAIASCAIAVTVTVVGTGLLAQHAGAAIAGETAKQPADWAGAKWIWLPGAQGSGFNYNQTVIARKKFTAHRAATATIRITADSFYRLEVNGTWVNDGPCRNWPEHYKFDAIDITSLVREGANELRVVGRYYGVGDFHRVPQRPGLLVDVELADASGKRSHVVSDGSWEMAEARAWLSNTPKVSIQMEPAEWYDARLEDNLRFRKAAIVADAEGGPWKDLQPRDVALMTRQPVVFKNWLGATVVKANALNFCLPAARLVNPGVIEANSTVSCASGMATLVEVATARTVQLQTEGFKLSVDGHVVADNKFALSPGKHVVLAFVRDVCGHEKEKSLRFLDPNGLKLSNPAKAGFENPWVFLRFGEYAFATNDILWMAFLGENRQVSETIGRYTRETDGLLTQVTDEASLKSRLGSRIEVLPSTTMFVQDSAWAFQHRQPVRKADALVHHPSGLIHNNSGEATVVEPAADGDVELLYDLGEQDCGYYDFEINAPAGVVVDVFSIEYIAPDGRLQHSWGNRNGMRYITREGVNRFTSLKRRSGRYVFLMLREQHKPVSVRGLRLIESTYPVTYVGSFSCSDSRLDKIWDISTRTLKLCMEDTYTDCPLYEQTHWVGDARNESLLAYGVFGATDLARRCINITAQSLDHYPIAGCQTPSCWDTLLPAWSFLWGISTWDYYWYTGDKEFLRSIYPAVIRNLRGAERFVDAKGLFSGAFWNLFDWTGADQSQKAVLHNNMFMVGAIDAALKEAAILGNDSDTAWLGSLRKRLVKGANDLWDNNRKSYPDSVHDDGSPSPSTCQHTSFLSLLYDVVPAEHAEEAKQNLLNPPEKMIRIGSPFAMLYLYETFEKLGMEDQIVREIYRNYLQMVEADATTVWESFPTGTTGSNGFPTRSHCHAWSSAPSRFLNRIILGVKETEAAAAKVTISPRLNGLEWARGTVATAKGPVRVSWRKQGDKLTVDYSAPEGVAVSFARNDSHQGLSLVVNGQDMK